MITPLAFLGRTVAGPLLGSKVFWEIMLAVGLLVGIYAWQVHEQNLGAYREQAKQQAAQLVAERAQAKAQAKAQAWRLKVSQDAARNEHAEVLAYSEAMQHDQQTIDWMAVCGDRPLPARMRDYILGGLPPAAVATNSADARHASDR